MSFFGGLIAFAFGAILRLLFMLVSFSYNMIIVLANVDLFGFNSSTEAGTLWHSISTRIYILLGIFMLFRVGFSMLQYIVNPDKMTDKQAGIGNLIKRAIIALVILVMFQPALAWLMKFQNTIISSNVLGTIILGVQGESYKGDEENAQKNMGETLPFTVITSLTSISKEWDEANGNVCADYATLAEINASDDTACKDKLAEGLDESKYGLDQMLQAKNWQRWFDVEITTKGTGMFLESATFQSNYLLLAIVAIVLIWCLFSLGLQLGIRIIKIGFLALIAPIPIISYIEPSQGKNGMLGKWAKEFAKTYLMLFIRLAALYFAILIVVIVANNIGIFSEIKNYDGSEVTDNIFMASQVKVIVIIAAFIFADQVPKMIENIFGLKMEGGMFKSPFRQMRESKSLMGLSGGLGTGKDAALRANRMLRGTKNPNGGLTQRNGLLGKLNNIQGDSKAAKLARRIGQRRRTGGLLSDAYGNATTLFGKDNRSKLKQELKDAQGIRGKAGALKNAGKEAKNVLATDATKIGSTISEISRSAQDGAKYMQEHKDEGFFENIVDSSVKSKERLANRLSRSAQDMERLRMGDDIKIESDKKALESQKQSVQVAKSKMEEEKRLRTEAAKEDTDLKGAWDSVTDTMEKEMGKKNDLLKDHERTADALKTRYETAEADLGSLRAQKEAVEIQQVATPQTVDISNRISQLQTELANVEATVMMPNETPAQFTARIDAKKQQIQAEISNAQVQLSQAEAEAQVAQGKQEQLNKINAQIQAQEQLVASAKAANDVAQNKMAAIKDILLEAALEVDFKRGTKSAADYLEELTLEEQEAFEKRYLEKMASKDFEIPSDVIQNFKERGIKSLIGGEDLDQFRVNVEAFERKLDGYLRERLPKKLENLEQYINNLPQNTPEEIQYYNNMSADYENQKKLLDAMIAKKEEQGYYDRDSLSKFIKSRKRVGDAEMSKIAAQFDDKLAEYETVIKDLSTQIDEKSEELKAIREATRGAGVHNETFNTGDLGHGPGPGGPPPGE